MSGTRARRCAALALAIALISCGTDRALPGSVGTPAPAYGARTLSGDPVELASLRGDVVLLNVWATWCHPCREEIPALQRLHERMADSGLRLVGVSVDAGGEGRRVEAFAREFGVTYDIWLDPDDRVSDAFYTLGVPTTMLIDRAGIVRWRHTGPVKDTDPALLRALDAALADSAAGPAADG